MQQLFYIKHKVSIIKHPFEGALLLSRMKEHSLNPFPIPIRI